MSGFNTVIVLLIGEFKIKSPLESNKSVEFAVVTYSIANEIGCVKLMLYFTKLVFPIGTSEIKLPSELPVNGVVLVAVEVVIIPLNVLE